MTGPASSSSCFSYQWPYDVFLNFRGEDTRNGFVGNLFNSLRQKGIQIFMDDGELRKGDEITPSLFKAIEESRMAITVFSKNYASSTFCLDELVKILQCIKGNGRLVLPIFYDVEPSYVRHQKGNYEEAFAMHQKNFKANEEMVQNWKLALREAANLSGLHFNPRGMDVIIIKEMVQDAHGFNPTYGIGVLMDKCLINIENDCVKMHDLIQDMGREIVRQESPNEPGKRNRLWNHEDIVHVLENNTMGCQNCIPSSSSKSLTLDPLEWDYELTCQKDQLDLNDQIKHHY